MTSSYRSPSALLDALGVEQPEDIDVEAIAQYCGATVLYELLTDCEARIIGHRDRAIITVNSASRRARQRFSAAHELGHWLCDRGRIAFTCTKLMLATEWHHENPETRANRFAADLLLPEMIFRPDARNQDMTFASVRKLADRYETSLTATAIRLVELGSFPAMLVCNERGSKRWKWFVRSPDLPENLWPADEPSPDSVAADLLRDADGKEAPTDVPAGAWFDHEAMDRYVIHEDSTRSGDLVLSLLWWRDEQQLIELT